jgi:hypothetical protein
MVINGFLAYALRSWYWERFFAPPEGVKLTLLLPFDRIRVDKFACGHQNFRTE